MTAMLLSCNSSNLGSQSINKQDSLQITNTFYCYLNSGHFLFKSFADEEHRILGLDVEHIYYSPDSTKMFAITYLKFKDTLGRCSNSESSIFYFYPFVGYRNNTSIKWKVLFYQTQLLLEGCNKMDLNEYLEDNFVGTFNKTKIDYYFNNETIEKEVGSNINEDQFWDSPFWQKGGLIKDKYFFEVKILDYDDSKYELIDEIECEDTN
jgi:hypothetical protein